MPLKEKNWSSAWAYYTGCIIHAICKEVLDNFQVTVKPYRNFRLGQPPNDYAFNFLKKLFIVAKESYPKELQLKKGGYVEITNIIEKYTWRRFNKIKFHNNKIHLINSATNHTVTLSQSEDNYGIFSVRFGGPTELGFLGEFGILLDLPWYIDGQIYSEKPATIKGIEYISPMSTNCIYRSPISFGGKGKRLNPTGYSLVEYKSEKIINLIERIIDYKDINEHDLFDWKYLILNYPKTKQKIGKSQSSIKSFRDYCEKNAINRIKSGDLQKLERLFANKNKNPLYFGSELIEVLGLISYLKENCSPYCNHLSSERNINFLKSKNIVNNDNLMDPYVLSALVLGISNPTANWLSKRGWKNKFSTTFSNDLRKALANIKSTGRRAVSKGCSVDRIKGGGGMGHTIKALRIIADAYYSFAAFSSASLLKANIIIPFILLGGKEFKNSILEVTGKRDRVCNYFTPQLFDINDEKTKTPN